MTITKAMRRRDVRDDMRAWLLDCFGGDEEAARYIQLANHIDLLRSIERLYVGGMEQFMLDGNYFLAND